jgi:dTDP-4-amino-4,6-dideoxygalactose transaminase
LAYPAVEAMSEVSQAVVVSFDKEGWRQARRRNVQVLSDGLREIPWVDVLRPTDSDSAPFSAVLVTDKPERRQEMIARLLEGNIYPAVLWPLEKTVVPVGDETLDLSRRLLSIHCDGRHDAEDMARILRVVTGKIMS